MDQGHRWLWLIILLWALTIAFAPSVVADDHDEDEDEVEDEDEDEDDDDRFEDAGESLGEISAWLLGLTLAYFGWKRILPPIRKQLKAAEQKEQLKRLNSWNKRAIPVHTLLGTAAIATGFIHGLMMDDSHPTLWIAIFLMGVLSVSGGLMRWKWPPREVKKGARLLHMQRLLSIVVVILLLLGHEAL